MGRFHDQRIMGGGKGKSGGKGGKGKSKGGGKGGGKGWYDEGPPESVLPAGEMMHTCEGEMVCKSLFGDKVPYFNAPIYLENISQIGKVDEILGAITDVMFTVKMESNMSADSYSKGDKVYINPAKLLPMERFLPQPKSAIGKPKGKGGKGGKGKSGKGKGKSGGKGKGFKGGRG